MNRKDALSLYKSRNFRSLYSRDRMEYLELSRSSGQYAIFADFVQQNTSPEIVLDVGCGRGDLVYELRKKGVKAWGFDASDYIFDGCLASEFLFVLDVLSDPWFFGEMIFDSVCIFEVMEHFVEEDIAFVLDRCCFVAKSYIIGTIPDDSLSPDHFCIRPREWWNSKFAEREFEVVDVGNSLKGLDPYFHPYLYRRVSND